MSEQQVRAIQDMSEWLSHPSELGKKPTKVEIAGEFYLHYLRYYIVKYKKSTFGNWLVGVVGGYEKDQLEHCGHVFSEMEVYDEDTAMQKCVDMAEKISEYWLNEAKKAEENKANPNESSRVFCGSVLLNSKQIDINKIINELKNRWQIIPTDEYEIKDDAVVFNLDQTMVAVSLMPVPIPAGEAEYYAESNYMWNEAVEITKTHQAHILVAIMHHDIGNIEAGKLYTKVIDACLTLDNTIGVYTSGTVFQPEFYQDAAATMKEGDLPIFAWIYFGVYQNEDGNNSYTYGLEQFGKSEMEILGSKNSIEDIHNMLYDLSYYVIEGDMILQGGETIGFSATQKLQITKSVGVSVENDSLKIEF